MEQLDAQIALRPPTLEHWKQTGIHPEFLKLLFKEIIVEIGWQNDHFIPNDSLDIVLFPHSYSDGGELIAIIYQSERKLGVRIRDAFKPEDLRKQNFGEFVGRCWAEVETFCVGPWVGRQEVLEMDRSRN